MQSYLHRKIQVKSLGVGELECRPSLYTISVLCCVEINACITYCFTIVSILLWLLQLVLVAKNDTTRFDTGCDIQVNDRKRVTVNTELHYHTLGKQVQKDVRIAATTTKHMAHKFCSVATALLGNTPFLPLIDADWFASDANTNWRRTAVMMQLRQQVASGKGERDLTSSIRLGFSVHLVKPTECLVSLFHGHFSTIINYFY